ncbi:MAG: hypothetical protein E6K80_15015 [Candidatus Eisenbacteria bacterium]|uniref:Uncharacterized protein n=1 Tax=Eiseniibacteriota bacterium TaxID=2212470 RepID=A0A538TVQ7_UNCEI|nr:MAG: hypothetical protein E6K80_15015 [Candidatus Eisenbacteria bacterium]
MTSNLVTIPFDPNNFVSGVTNPYLPLVPGTTFTYRNLLKTTEELNTIEVTRDRKTILGVAVTVVHDQVFLADGSLAEDTFDWYAQDEQGNVWYFGEDTKEYDHGVLVTTAGSWEAGKNGALAGIVMLADPHVGDVYKQEDAPGVVADMAKVVSLDETLTVPYGTFTHCIETTEWTPVEPGDRSHKFYARNVGNVLEVATRQGGETDELVAVK